MATPEFHGQRRLAAFMGSQRVGCDSEPHTFTFRRGQVTKRVHCPLCCGHLPGIVCECRVIVSSIVRNGLPSGSCMPTKSLQSCIVLASGFFNPYRLPVVNNSPAMQEMQDTRV